jgi:hypothetical protein
MTVRGRTHVILTAVSALLALNVLAAFAQPAGDPVSGIVAEVSDEAVSLTNGAGFGIDPQTRVILVRPATPADLTPGYYVAITARPEMDGSLLASIVNTFPEEQRGTGEGQRPMDGGNLMTNANIDDAVLDMVSGAELQVSYLGETQVVKITPETRIEIRVLGSLADVVPGADVTGLVVDGVARTIQVR